MAVSLIQNLSVDFDPSRYEDEYRKALWELIEAKVSGQELVSPVRAEEPGKVVDLMEALRASVQLAEENRAGKGPESKKGARRKKAKAGVG